jgi:uncharacterized membrane protein YraQ (UPF0718 family)
MRTVGGIVAKNRLLSSVLLAYLVLAGISPQKALVALGIGMGTLLDVTPIVLSVFVFIGLVHVWVKEETIVKHLGHESGFRGVALGAVLGTALNGPLFTIFPLAQSLIRKGARVGVIAAVFSTYAIKVPLLPLEIGFLGLKFTVAHNLMMFLSAFLMAPLMELMMGGRTVEGSQQPTA